MDPDPGTKPSPAVAGERSEISDRTCPRCGQNVTPRATGRPATWCSQACRRAAYEERRAAANGAIAVTVVDRVHTVEHPLSVCVDHTISSPAGCRRVIHALAQLARDGTLAADPKWESTQLAIGGLLDALYAPTRGRR